jgi:hypothetical protein
MEYDEIQVGEEIADAAISFEARKISVRQNRDGVNVTFLLHPSDLPSPLLVSPVGTRYLVSAVEVGDDEKPVPLPERVDGRRLVTSAGMLCREPRFQRWLIDAGLADGASEEDAAAAVCHHCSIESRKELATNQAAARLFKRLRREYLEEVQSRA